MELERKRKLNYIGKTNKIATVLRNQIPKLKQPDTRPIERRYIFSGAAGTGKTTLAEELGASICNGNMLGVEQVNGQSVSVELVRRWQMDGYYNLGCRAIIVDEIDAASGPALGQLRTYLDKLPPRVTFIATTNKTLNELPDSIQSRFKQHTFEPVPAQEIKSFIMEKFKLNEQVAGSIAVGSKGNVRAAEADARSVVEAMQPIQ